MNIWPSDFVVNDSDIQGISPLPIIWVIGPKESGKSTLVATIDPVRPKQQTRTLVTDLEMSYSTIAAQTPIDRLDIRTLTRDRVGKDYTLKDIFVTWREQVLAHEAGEYTVLGVDPVSDLFQGAFMWVGENAQLFGKNAANYNGTMGTKAQWGDTSLYWKQLALELASRYETTVFVSHIKDVYKENVRTGKQAARGADFSEVASLVLWLERNGQDLSATVIKSRLSWWDWGDESEQRTRPILRDLLPRKLKPEYSGQSYPELIASYMKNPQADYGDLNAEHDPTQEVVSVEEAQARADARQTAELEIATAKGRTAMIKMLIEEGYYGTAVEIARVAKENNITFSLAKADETFKLLADLGKQKND